MKIKLLSSVIFLLACFAGHGQSNSQTSIEGSWIGKLAIPNGPTIPLLMHFKADNKIIEGTFDSPEQSVKGWAIDSVWLTKDSLFADFSARLGPQGKRIKFRGFSLDIDRIEHIYCVFD